jgi:hypothetical protein
MEWLSNLELNYIVNPIEESKLGDCLERSCAIGTSGASCCGDEIEIIFNK